VQRGAVVIAIEVRVFERELRERVGAVDDHFDSSRPYDWLYFPGATFGDGAKRIILASPTASTRSEKDRRERIAVFADGHDAIWPESKFQQYLKQLSIELTSPGTRSK